MPEETQWDLAVLDFAVYVVASSTNRGNQHALRLSYVPRVGVVAHERTAFWSTHAIPRYCVDYTNITAQAAIEEALTFHYGIQDHLAK